MKTRRRRIVRDDTVAPWLTLLVIVALWWAGARLVMRNAPNASAFTTTTPDAPSASASAREGERRPDVAASARDGERRREALASARASELRRDVAEAASSREGGPAAPASTRGSELRRDVALVPVAGVAASSLTSTFNDARGGGSRRHEAMDILAPRGTPVVASVRGRIVKLFTSAAGGLTIYQFDSDETYCYYYAHLDSYASDVTEGQTVASGQVIGYVGTTGNAPPGTPHLHFAIFRLGPEKRWWEGDAIDPITILR
jgi:murein DD-endopeptidase MepM/ murein hydrolase activator NlpD